MLQSVLFGVQYILLLLWLLFYFYYCCYYYLLECDYCYILCYYQIITRVNFCEACFRKFIMLRYELDDDKFGIVPFGGTKLLET